MSIRRLNVYPGGNATGQSQPKRAAGFPLCTGLCVSTQQILGRTPLESPTLFSPSPSVPRSPHLWHSDTEGGEGILGDLGELARTLFFLTRHKVSGGGFRRGAGRQRVQARADPRPLLQNSGGLCPLARGREDLMEIQGRAGQLFGSWHRVPIVLRDRPAPKGSPQKCQVATPMTHSQCP